MNGVAMESLLSSLKAAGEGLAHMAHNLEPARPVVQALDHVLADPSQGPAAGRAGGGTGMDRARAAFGHGLPDRLETRSLDRLGDGRRRGLTFGLIGLQRLNAQFALLDALPKFLGGGAETRTL
ncbi:hypothetical protein ACQKGT_15940 [Methylobacterium sp. NPDC052247]|uniref:hypothetical protein n=1 Tax=unclassified Methylobacterium TaxID=2615210 RepID=UPI003C2F642C